MSRDSLACFGPGLRRAAWPAVVVLGFGAEWLARSGQSLAAAGADLAVGWTLIACGLIAWSRRPQSRIGALIALSGFTWFLGTLAGSQVGAIGALGVALLTLHRGPLFHAIVSYPSGRTPGRVDVFAVLVGYAYAATVALARNNVVTIVVISLVLVTTVRGYALAAGPERRARVVAMLAAMAVALTLAVGSVERLRGAESPTLERAVLWGYEVALVLIAVGFLLDLLRGRWAQSAVTRLVVDLGEDSETGTLRARLAHALGDRSLTIAYWLPETNGYVDERRDPVAPPDAGPGRAVTLIEQQGERIAALVHEASVLDDPDLIDAVASAAKIALSNAHLRAEVRRQVAELDASRRRILEASDAQRRRLQQELRVGVGQRLEDVRELLERALREAHSVPNRPGTEGLEDTERELNQIRVEVEELAAGIHPLLSERGLGPALSSLGERAPCPVRLVVPTRRLPVSIETTVYFVCSEALTNVAKYARASRVDVEVRSVGDTVTVLIADDGVGGADPAAGSGLMGLADRIEALGGRLLVESPAGRGTRLRADIPTGQRDEVGAG